MPTALEIVNWSKTFETANSRKLQRLRYYPGTIGTDSRGFRALARRGEEGFAALGLFQALLQAFATLRKPARNADLFLHSDGAPFSAAEIWELARVPPSVAEKFAPYLIEVQWIKWRDLPAVSHLDADSAPPPPTDPPTTSHSHPKNYSYPTLPHPTVPNQTPPQTIDPGRLEPSSITSILEGVVEGTVKGVSFSGGGGGGGGPLIEQAIAAGLSRGDAYDALDLYRRQRGRDHAGNPIKHFGTWARRIIDGRRRHQASA